MEVLNGAGIIVQGLTFLGSGCYKPTVHKIYMAANIRGLDKKSVIRQYRNLQRAKTKSNIKSHYTVHVLRTTNHTYFERLVKINSICKCCNISVKKNHRRASTSVICDFLSTHGCLRPICAARFHAHVSLAGKEGVTLSVRSGGTNR